MNTENIDVYQTEVQCIYREEYYLVRDNGSVCRKSRPGKRVRQLDDYWTFGSKNANGYRLVSHHPVHQIVATAFHGESPTEEHVVDHIDTNRENNCPDHLRWVTRAENLFDNPITRTRIESIWGSIEAMLGHFKYLPPELDSDSLTPLAMQRRWKTPCEFPVCPSNFDRIFIDNADDIEQKYELLAEYFMELVFGSVFSRNIFGESITVQAGLTKGSEDYNFPRLIVLCSLPGGVKAWAVASVTIENGYFVHENLGSFFTLQGALKTHCGLLGESLNESIDDYC